MYMTLEGIYGVAIDVSSSLIILFTIFGAFLQYSGAGKFYIDFSFSAMGGKPTGAGRTVVLASFLLGGPSGSGVATTVTLGAVAYPMLAKVGYEKNAAGGLLAAGGLGAIISPPVLGAAAFLIAEFLKISYLDVLLMAVIPTLLFYLALFLMVEIDARKYGMGNVAFEQGRHGLEPDAQVLVPLPVAGLDRRLHDVGLLAGAVGVLGHRGVVRHQLPAPRHGAVLLRPVHAARARWSRTCSSRPSSRRMEGGSIGVLNVAATCAGAGIIVGVVTLTGLGLKFSSIVIDYAGGSLLLTAIFTSLVVWIVGLAVPVTASYIICAVIAAPALIKLGVPDFAAHMFIFYYAVLSRGLAADRAVAVRGRGHHRRRPVQDHAAMLEVHRAGVPGAVHVRARPERPGPAADGLDRRPWPTANWWSIAEVTLTAPSASRALAGRLPGLGLQAHHAGRALDADRGRLRAGLPGPRRRRGRLRAGDRGRWRCSISAPKSQPKAAA